jgi:SSS family solute:Na+ symporter
METKIAVLAAYFLAVLVVGLIARSRLKATPQSYFLADRGLGTAVLLATMAATNFSAFTVFGASGAGYRDGWSFYPIMGFGTGFMALTFWLIGRRAWRVAKRLGVITPPGLVERLYGSRPAGLLFAAVMVIFTLPYLALQPMAAGYALQELVGLPYAAGAGLTTAVIALYTLRGGMRAVAWTDLLQGTLMLALLAAALVIAAGRHGGFAAASRQVFELHPELFRRPGGLGHYAPGIWFSYLALWFFCDPMFPQLFQRFFAAKREAAITRMMLLYPLVCSVVFFAPVALGVLGRLSFPGLAGKEADRILPLMVNALAGDGMAALVTAGGLAALMSTMDSQLLTLSSIFTADILPALARRPPATSLSGRGAVLLLAGGGLLLALKPPATLLEIATQTFTGLAVLFPTVLFGLFLQRRYPAAAIASIAAGEAALALFHFKLLPAGPFLPVVWVMAAAFGAYAGVHAAIAARRGGLVLRAPAWIADPWLWGYAAVMALAVDFWAWGEGAPGRLGLPGWALWFMGLAGLQTALMVLHVRSASKPAEAAPPPCGLSAPGRRRPHSPAGSQR